MDLGRFGLGLFIVGLTIMLIMFYDGRSIEMDHETLTFREGYVEMGPHDPGHYRWSVWVEDYYRGSGEDDGFDVYASEDPPGHASYSISPQDDTVREFDHIECLLEHGWEPWSWAEGEVYFCVEAGDPLFSEDDTVEVYLVRSGSNPMAAVTVVGLIIMTVGLVFIVLWWRSKDS